MKARLRRLISAASVLPYALSLACLAAGAALFAQKLSFPDKNELSDAIKRGTRVVVDLHNGRIYGRLRPRSVRSAGQGVASLSVSASSEEAGGHPVRQNGAGTVTVPVPGTSEKQTSPAADKKPVHGKKKEPDASPLPAKEPSPHDETPAEGLKKEEEGLKSEIPHGSGDQTAAHPERSASKSASEDEDKASSEPVTEHPVSVAEPAKPAEKAVSDGGVTTAPGAKPPSDGLPMIAVVVKGVGLSSSGTEAAIALPPEFTLGFSPYAPNLKRNMKDAVDKGHEALLNIPMEAKDFNVRDAGPFSLSASLTEDENLGRLGVTLAQDVPLTGVYTDPDERFTARPDAVAPVLARLRKHGLMLAYGSGYASYSFFQEAAKQGFTQAAGADVQLDQVNDAEGVSRKLEEALAVAKRRGFAVVMASPYPATLRQLSEWAAGLKSEGKAGKPRAHVAPLSALKKLLESQASIVAGAKDKETLKNKEPEGSAGAKQ